MGKREKAWKKSVFHLGKNVGGHSRSGKGNSARGGRGGIAKNLSSIWDLSHRGPVLEGGTKKGTGERGL